METKDECGSCGKVLDVDKDEYLKWHNCQRSNDTMCGDCFDIPLDLIKGIYKSAKVITEEIENFDDEADGTILQNKEKEGE